MLASPYRDWKYVRWGLYQWQYVVRNHWDNLCSSGSNQYIFGQEFSWLVRTTSAWMFWLNDIYIMPAQTLSVRGYILLLVSEDSRLEVWIWSRCNLPIASPKLRKFWRSAVWIHGLISLAVWWTEGIHCSDMCRRNCLNPMSKNKGTFSASYFLPRIYAK